MKAGDIVNAIRWRLAWLWSELQAHGEAYLRNMPGELGIWLRRRWHGWPEGVRVLHDVEIHHSDKLRLGRNVTIAAGCKLNAAGGIVISHDVLIGPGVCIWSQNHRFDLTAVPIADQGYELDPVVICGGCWVGCGSIVLPGSVLQPGVVVAAGSVVTEACSFDIRPFDIIAGVPAKRIGNRLTKEREAS